MVAALLDTLSTTKPSIVAPALSVTLPTASAATTLLLAMFVILVISFPIVFHVMYATPLTVQPAHLQPHAQAVCLASTSTTESVLPAKSITATNVLHLPIPVMPAPLATPSIMGNVTSAMFQTAPLAMDSTLALNAVILLSSPMVFPHATTVKIPTVKPVQETIYAKPAPPTSLQIVLDLVFFAISLAVYSVQPTTAALRAQVTLHTPTPVIHAFPAVLPIALHATTLIIVSPVLQAII